MTKIKFDKALNFYIIIFDNIFTDENISFFDFIKMNRIKKKEISFLFLGRKDCMMLKISLKTSG
jgi:hypothetical protein